MSFSQRCNRVALAVAVSCLAVFAGRAQAVTNLQASDGGGVLNLQTIDLFNDAPPIVDLQVLFQQTAIAPTGVPFTDPIDPLFTGDLDAILLANALTRLDVYDVLFNRVTLEPLVEFMTDTTINEATGTVWTGDLDDPGSITVITGQLDIITTNTTTTTPRFDDTLTIHLYAGVDQPPPGGVIPEPMTASLALLSLGTLGVTMRRGKNRC
ncbi:MAG: hypothetical protein WD768_00035 [Phycisphaeraceae bacterium]